MKIEQFSGKEERRVLIGMVVDSIVLARVAPSWKKEMFRSKWANIVGDICIRYFKEQGKAPMRSLEPLFESWALKAQDPDTIRLAERFVSGLSSEWAEQKEKINRGYLIDLAQKHFNKVKLERLATRIQAHLEVGDVERAEEIRKAYTEVSIDAQNKGINVTLDDAALARAFAEKEDSIIRMPGALSKIFRYAFHRRAFVAFNGPEKVGKTTWKVFTSWQAMLQRRRVVYFAAGDEPEEEMMMRFSTLAARRPKRAGEYFYPVRVRKEELAAVGVLERRFAEEPLTKKQARIAFRRAHKELIKSNDPYLKLFCYPTDTLTMEMVDAKLDELARDGYVADLIVVDYIDIMKQSGDSKDFRHNVDSTWKAARKLSIKHHAIFLTSTQTNVKSYEVGVITRKNFTEDKRKHAHVTAEYGINQTDDERRTQAQRINCFIARSFKFSPNRVVRVAGCMELQNPAIKTML